MLINNNFQDVTNFYNSSSSLKSLKYASNEATINDPQKEYDTELTNSVIYSYNKSVPQKNREKVQETQDLQNKITQVQVAQSDFATYTTSNSNQKIIQQILSISPKSVSSTPTLNKPNSIGDKLNLDLSVGQYNLNFELERVSSDFIKVTSKYKGVVISNKIIAQSMDSVESKNDSTINTNTIKDDDKWEDSMDKILKNTLNDFSKNLDNYKTSLENTLQDTLSETSQLKIDNVDDAKALLSEFKNNMLSNTDNLSIYSNINPLSVLQITR